MTEISHEIGGAGSGAGLLKTGQTTQYDSKYDDGYYEKGISKAYTILTTGQYSGATNITLNAKTNAHSNNCVYDQKTKLMWSRYVPGSVGPASDGKLPWTTNVNGEGIFDYCAAANLALLSGYSDWRIPNFLELFSLAVIEAPFGSIDLVTFPSFPYGSYIHTSSTRPDTTTYVTCLLMSSGGLLNAAKTNNYNFPLVRGG